MTTSVDLPELDWAKCGTPAQARAHYRRGEQPCRRCRAAVARYQREYRAKRRDRNAMTATARRQCTQIGMEEL